MCALYVRVDSRCDATDDYQGFVKESSFGTVTITDCLIAPQCINRRQSHVSRGDKDCFYVALTQKGHQVVEQRGQRLAYGPGSATIFSASEPYTLRNPDAHRAFYLEIPRAALAQRWQPSRPMVTASVNTAYGVGRIVADLCASMVLEADTLPEVTRAQLGERLIDVLALALDSPNGEVPHLDGSVKSERLRQIMRYIELNIGDPLLNPERVAAACQMSVRALHYLFKGTGQSVAGYHLGAPAATLPGCPGDAGGTPTHGDRDRAGVRLQQHVALQQRVSPTLRRDAVGRARRRRLIGLRAAAPGLRPRDSTLRASARHPRVRGTDWGSAWRRTAS